MVDSIILVFKLTSLAVLVSLNHSPSCVLVFGAFPGYVTRCFTFMSSQFLPPRPTKVTIYATQCRHFLSFFPSFSGAERILGYVRPRRMVALHPPKRGKRRSIWRSLQIETAVARRCDVIGHLILLRRMQTLNWDSKCFNISTLVTTDCASGDIRRLVG